MTDSYQALQERADALARQIMDRMPRSNGVGSRHHTVPRFLLEPFSRSGQIAVRELVTEKPYLGSIKDLAITDFYTVVVDLPEPAGGPTHAYDGRLETILADMEGTAAEALREFRRTPRPSMQIYRRLSPSSPRSSMYAAHVAELNLRSQSNMD